MTQRVLGVDPGLSGGLALLDTDLDLLVVRDMPVVRVGKSRILHLAELTRLVVAWEPTAAWVERVHSMPKQGVASTFSFGMNYGLIRGVLAGLKVRTVLVTPQEWKRLFRLGSDKRESRVTAGLMFPSNAGDFSRVKDDGRAEAALLALFGSGQRLS